MLSDDTSSPLIVKNIETVRTLKYGVEEKENLIIDNFKELNWTYNA